MNKSPGWGFALKGSLGRIVPPRASNHIPRLSISTNGQQNALASLLREGPLFFSRKNWEATSLNDIVNKKVA